MILILIPFIFILNIILTSIIKSTILEIIIISILKPTILKTPLIFILKLIIFYIIKSIVLLS